jgi:hypothetical protein
MTSTAAMAHAHPSPNANPNALSCSVRPVAGDRHLQCIQMRAEASAFVERLPELRMQHMSSLTGIGVVVACAAGALWLAARAIRWARKGTRGGKMVASALFLFPDQPPPQELVEQQTRLRKDSEAGDPE